MALNLQDKQAIVAEVNEAAKGSFIIFRQASAMVSIGRDTVLLFFFKCTRSRNLSIYFQLLHEPIQEKN